MAQIHKFGRNLFNGILLVMLIAVTAIFLLNFVNLHMPALKCINGEIHDSEISHPYKGDTVTTVMLVCGVIVAPFAQILTTEWFYGKASSDTDMSETIIKRFNRIMIRACTIYRNYFYGIAVVVLLTDFAKSTLNFPRPHWLDSCKPTFPAASCKLGWLYDYECTNSNISRMDLADARKSFPSGHSVTAFYAAIFMTIYQHRRVNKGITGTVFLLWLHILWFGFAIFCSMSRVTDKRHHPIDVAFGGLLGALGGIFATLILSNNFKAFVAEESLIPCDGSFKTSNYGSIK